MDSGVFIKLLKKEVVPALGCTEPIAVAYATAKAVKVLGEKPEKIQLWLSANIIKNGMGVGIPGTDMIGLNIAAALGAVGGDSEEKLEVLKHINHNHLVEAQKMLSENKVQILLKETSDKLYIEVLCSSKDNYAKVIIKDKHTNVVLVERNNEILFKDSNNARTKNGVMNNDEITIKDIYNFVTSVDFKDIEFLLDGARMNKIVSEEGLNKEYGLQVGKKLKEAKDSSPFNDSIANYIVSVTAAASDARMAGCALPIMSTAGSGNQGITATLPSVALSEMLGKSSEELARALALSNLVTIHMKSYIGRLSPLCGCGVAASTGSCCAITYLLGGNLEKINSAIKNMVSDIAGMICDGAKSSCALKIATSVNAAIQCAILALDNIEVSENNGIIDKDVEKTIRNLANIGTKGMETTDKVILDIMVCK